MHASVGITDMRNKRMDMIGSQICNICKMGYSMLSKAEAEMPDIVITDSRKERGYRECISRYCREKGDRRKSSRSGMLGGYWSIGVGGR